MTKQNAEVPGRPARGKLLEAIGWRDTERAKELIAQGADVNETDDEGLSPLILATLTSSSDLSLVELLIEKGADVNHKSVEGYTPLMGAAKPNDEAVVSLLLEKGARIDERSYQGHTALTWAVMNQGGAVVRLLLENGADPEAKGTDGSVPLERIGAMFQWDVGANLSIHQMLTEAVESRRRAAAERAVREARAAVREANHAVAVSRQQRLIALAKKSRLGAAP